MALAVFSRAARRQSRAVSKCARTAAARGWRQSDDAKDCLLPVATAVLMPGLQAGWMRRDRPFSPASCRRFLRPKPLNAGVRPSCRPLSGRCISISSSQAAVADLGSQLLQGRPAGHSPTRLVCVCLRELHAAAGHCQRQWQCSRHRFCCSAALPRRCRRHVIAAAPASSGSQPTASVRAG